MNITFFPEYQTIPATATVAGAGNPSRIDSAITTEQQVSWTTESACTTARTLIGPDLSPQRATPETREAFDHVEQCTACQRFYAQQRSVAQRLRRLAENQPAPDHLNNAIRAAIDREARQIGQRRRVGYGALAGVVAAAAAVAIWIGVWPSDGVGSPVGPAVATSMRTASTSDSISSAEPQALREWFEAHAIPGFEIPDITGAQLIGGRVIRLPGTQGAAVDFVRNGRLLTYVMAPVPSWRQELAPFDILPVSSDGYEVAIWEEDGTTRAVLSSMPRQELLEIAEQCKYKRNL